MNSKEMRKCVLCGKPSERSICELCSAKVEGEARHKKDQSQKKGRVENDRLPPNKRNN
jgi:hypothetical protein